jgi:GNAT superfamily N-acetyltransferase
MKKDLLKGEKGNWKSENYKVSVNHANTNSDYVNIHAHDKDGNKVADSTFKHHGPHLRALDVDVKPEHRRKGIASAMYAHAEEHTGKKLHATSSDSSSRTSEGQALWSNPKRTFGKSENLSKSEMPDHLVIETIALNHDMKAVHGKAVKLSGEHLKNYLNDNPGLIETVKQKHSDRLNHHFGHDPELLAHAQNHGISATYKKMKNKEQV